MDSESIAQLVTLKQEKSDPNLPGRRERRQHARHIAPRLTLRFEGHNYKTTDWSIGGFRIRDFHRPVRRGEPLEGSVVTWLGLSHEAFKADVLRIGPEGEIACRFLTLPRKLLGAM
ncbi:MAG: PilZ domain-containing protein [Alphaproteobacteria bacterium]